MARRTAGTRREQLRLPEDVWKWLKEESVRRGFPSWSAFVRSILEREQCVSMISRTGTSGMKKLLMWIAPEPERNE